jgi:hypothetical protein
VQSLMLLTYWKEPADSSGWMKIGMAIRLGYSLFWHVPRTEPLPEDETQAREVLVSRSGHPAEPSLGTGRGLFGDGYGPSHV